jgi:hypothetical protein
MFDHRTARRIALQLAPQLPEYQDDALEVIESLREIVVKCFHEKTTEKPSDQRSS